ncbi:MAG: hypothetical protein ACOC3X_03110 [Nanoarchaeota archaeon]
MVKIGVKEDAKNVITSILGAASADKIDGFSDSDPKNFLDQCKQMLASLLGEGLAQQKLESLYNKYS